MHSQKIQKNYIIILLYHLHYPYIIHCKTLSITILVSTCHMKFVWFGTFNQIKKKSYHSERFTLKFTYYLKFTLNSISWSFTIPCNFSWFQENKSMRMCLHNIWGFGSCCGSHFLSSEQAGTVLEGLINPNRELCCRQFYSRYWQYRFLHISVLSYTCMWMTLLSYVTNNDLHSRDQSLQNSINALEAAWFQNIHMTVKVMRSALLAFFFFFFEAACEHIANL